MNRTLKILIVGGYGTFGGRLVELLEDESRLTLVVAGRSLAKATAYCNSRTDSKAQLIPTHFDRTQDIAAQLSPITPDIVVDASGPFQDYGKDAYTLVEACIAQGIHYLDLADGSAFVAGISTFDTAAQQAGVFVLSGVSSFPVLTAAVVQQLAAPMARVTAIRGGIAPSPYAGVGTNVIRAIASYAGQELRLTCAGTTITAYPLTESLRYTIAPPGYLPLKNTLFSLVDVPDLHVLSALWPEAKHIWMGAGPVPEILHRALIAFAWLVKFKIIKTLLPLAGLMEFVITRIRWGEHRGGMFVEVTGGDNTGAAVQRSWHLLAEGHDGPLIPSMAIEAIVRKILNGTQITPGARTGLCDVTLADYDALFSKRTIYTGYREDTAQGTLPLYQYLLGTTWEQLPAHIRDMHNFTEAASATGIATIRRGKNPLARLACFILGFPQAGDAVPVTVDFTVLNGQETWTRTFGGKSFASVQYAGRGRSERLLIERFGILTFAMALVHEAGRLKLVLRHWHVLGMPLPMWLCPKSDSYEHAEEGRFHFNVEISHPLTGLIVHYKGWLDIPRAP